MIGSRVGREASRTSTEYLHVAFKNINNHFLNCKYIVVLIYLMKSIVFKIN